MSECGMEQKLVQDDILGEVIVTVKELIVQANNKIKLSAEKTC